MTYDQAKQSIAVFVDPDLKEIMPGIIEDWTKEVSSMRRALEKSDYETIRRLGHGMKGTGGACGFAPVTDIGGSLEEAAGIMDSEAIRKSLDTLSIYLGEVEVVYG
ncbi:MAG: Hpt domain-containing protein [Deltaproteobacteria bacterium]|nr:MAG: Hpt domain-containing protein [Deltaproteobacteria bacterium]